MILCHSYLPMVLHISPLVYFLCQRISQAADACQTSDQVPLHSLGYTGWWMTFVSTSVSADALFGGWETESKVHSGTVSDESPKLLSSEEVAAKCRVEMDMMFETWLYPCKMHLPCLAHAHVCLSYWKYLFKYCLGEQIFKTQIEGNSLCRLR